MRTRIIDLLNRQSTDNCGGRWDFHFFRAPDRAPERENISCNWTLRETSDLLIEMGVLRRRLVHLHMTVAANMTVTGHHFIARRTTNPTLTRHRPVESDRHSKANDWTVILKGPPRRYYLRMLLPSPKYLLSIAHVNARRAPPAPGRHHRNLWTFYLALHLLVSSITSWKPVISRRLPESRVWTRELWNTELGLALTGALWYASHR